MRVSVPFRLFVYLLIGGACWVPTAISGTTDNTELEATVRALVRAISEKDLPAMSKLMAHDADIVSYSIGGRKYVAWPDLERDIKEEFANVAASEAMPVDDRTSARCTAHRGFIDRPTHCPRLERGMGRSRGGGRQALPGHTRQNRQRSLYTAR